MRERLEWSDMRMLRSVLVLLDTQSWHPRPSPTSKHSDTDEEEDDLDVIKEAMEYISSHFREPLEAGGVLLSIIHDEVEEIVPYA
jgi:hypothetical protein